MFEVVMSLLAFFAPILCWNELMKIRKIMERNETEGRQKTQGYSRH